MIRSILISLILLTILGCASRYEMNITGYGGLGSYQDKTYNFNLPADIRTDLEAMKYVGMLEKQLACAGWKLDHNSPAFIIVPSFGVKGPDTSQKPSVSFGGSFGMFGGGIGSGLSIGTFLGSSTDSPQTGYVKFLDIKLFQRGQTDKAPVWQGKIFNENDDKTLENVMPILIRFAVDNFGKDTDGSKEFTFDATKENLINLNECSTAG